MVTVDVIGTIACFATILAKTAANAFFKDLNRMLLALTNRGKMFKIEHFILDSQNVAGVF